MLALQCEKRGLSDRAGKTRVAPLRQTRQCLGGYDCNRCTSCLLNGPLLLIKPAVLNIRQPRILYHILLDVWIIPSYMLRIWLQSHTLSFRSPNPSNPTPASRNAPYSPSSPAYPSSTDAPTSSTASRASSHLSQGYMIPVSIPILPMLWNNLKGRVG